MEHRLLFVLVLRRRGRGRGFIATSSRLGNVSQVDRPRFKKLAFWLPRPPFRPPVWGARGGGLLEAPVQGAEVACWAPASVGNADGVLGTLHPNCAHQRLNLNFKFKGRSSRQMQCLKPGFCLVLLVLAIVGASGRIGDGAGRVLQQSVRVYCEYDNSMHIS